uniref:VIER F-box protein 2 n=1 Tax=Tanacetum cinerariifolium TaxID=118510 RepID=A0A6L2KLC4_TANCI|nr:VIER F-box protein 2 [Tanacetum cinerariifolium]
MGYSDPLDMAYRSADIAVETPKMKVIKEGSKKLGLVKINDDSFACNAPLGTIYNEFNRLSGMDDDFLLMRLVRLMDVTVEQWLDLMYGDHKKVDVKKQWVTHGFDADIKYDPSDVEFAKWLALKFYNHKTLDLYTNNELWIYWTRGDEEVELTDEEFFDPNDENLIDKDEVSEIFRIEAHIFDFETPTCKAFNKFNYLLKIDTDLLTSDILGFKTYYEFKNEWMDEWNKGIPWVLEVPWSENKIPINDIHHICEPFRFKNGMVRVGYITYFQDYEWYNELVDRILKEEALKKKTIYERSWGDATQERNHINKAYGNTNINANYNPYLDVSRTFNNHEERDYEEAIEEEREPNDDHDIDNLEYDLVRDNAPYHTNEDEEQED